MGRGEPERARVSMMLAPCGLEAARLRTSGPDFTYGWAMVTSWMVTFFLGAPSPSPLALSDPAFATCSSRSMPLVTLPKTV